MYDGYNRIFWGILLTTFSINLGPIKILPTFVGFLFIVSGLNVLYEESSLEEFKNIKSMGIIVTLLSFIGGIIGFLTQTGMDYSFLNTIWIIGFMIIELVYFFRIIGTSIGYLNDKDYGDIKEEYIIKLRRYTIFSILNTCFLSIVLILNFKVYFTIGAIIAIVLSIYMMTMVYGIRNIFTNPDAIEEDMD